MKFILMITHDHFIIVSVIYHGLGLKLPLVLSIVHETCQWNLWLCTDAFSFWLSQVDWILDRSFFKKFGHKQCAANHCPQSAGADNK